jgi:uncharacterized protein (UPF0212 family)
MEKEPTTSQTTTAETKKCPKCLEQIAVGAKNCKHCGADVRNWFMRHKLVSGGIGFILILSVADALVPGSDKDDAGSDDTAQSAKMAVIGDAVTDKDLKFTVLEVTTPESVGEDPFSKKPQGKFYVVKVKIENVSKETQTITNGSFSMTDSQNRTYETSSDGQAALMLSDEANDIFVEEIQPSLSIEGKVVFDVPTDAADLTLIAKGSIFSDGVKIKLNK